jgi:hypothetical protein
MLIISYGFRIIYYYLKISKPTDIQEVRGRTNRSVDLSAKFLRALNSTVILGSESRGNHDHILLSHGSGSRANTFQN